MIPVEATDAALIEALAEQFARPEVTEVEVRNGPETAVITREQYRAMRGRLEDTGRQARKAAEKRQRQVLEAQGHWLAQIVAKGRVVRIDLDRELGVDVDGNEFAYSGQLVDVQTYRQWIEQVPGEIGAIVDITGQAEPVRLVDAAHG